MTHPTVRILGTRGIPNRHGGFESFAEQLALHLVARGWLVAVYCQESGDGAPWESMWHGVRRVHIPVRQAGAWGTIVFDWRSTQHAVKEPGVVLVLGYNTAVFSLAYRRRRIANLLNMDGMEWQRAKYGLPAKAWFYANEQLGARVAGHLIADHPMIAKRLLSLVSPAKISMIPYSSPTVGPPQPSLVSALGVQPHGYALVVARPEPENSILEIVQGWARKTRGASLVILGDYAATAYGRRVAEAAGPEVVFLGPIYERDTVVALRAHCMLYLHGHRVGGTNPSLVESLACGAAVVAHDNPYNRWVAGSAGAYFADEASCSSILDRLLACSGTTELNRMRAAARERYYKDFTPERVLGAYERLLQAHSGGPTGATPRAPEQASAP